MNLIALFVLTLGVCAFGALYKKGFLLNRSLLRFSGAFFLTLVFTHYLPESYELGGSKVGLWVLVGFALQIILDFFSKGVEHGHVHKEHLKGYTLWSALVLHSLVEGAAIQLSHSDAWLVGVIVHKIPVAFILGWMLFRTEMPRKRAWLLLTIFAVSTPLGMLVSSHLPLANYTAAFTAMASGLLMHVSTIILFEADTHHKFELKKLAIMLLGIAFAFFI